MGRIDYFYMVSTLATWPLKKKEYESKDSVAIMNKTDSVIDVSWLLKVRASRKARH